MSYHLIDCIERLGEPHLLVLGDLILDRYIWGEAERISQEAPVILLREENDELRLGGAANVAQMIRGLDAHVTLAGLVGDDADGTAMREALADQNISDRLILTDPDRPTTVKRRYLGHAQHRHPHQMLRVDREVRTPISDALADELLRNLEETIDSFDAVLISDYAKGVCRPDLLSRLVTLAKSHGLPVIADPASGVDYERYTGVTAMTPNRTETGRAVDAVIDSCETGFTAGQTLRDRLGLDHIFVTLDKDGIALVDGDGSEVLLPTRPREVCDITGAGDMVLAMIGVGAAAGLSPRDLGSLANVAGGLEVEQVGVVTLSRDDLLGDLLTGSRTLDDKRCELDEVARHVAARRRLGQRVVMTNGCFDVLHTGHISYLQQAANEGDCLVVALNSDDSIRGLGKGDDRPVFSEDHRSVMLAALEAVDYVVIFGEATPHRVIEQLRPDLLVKGGTYSREEIVGWELVDAYGGEVKPMGVVPGISTTEILRQLRSPTPTNGPSLKLNSPTLKDAA